ncbi:MAG: cob(I)yrinic acid a,c-diamide adenosyltransferase [Alphaproteobacteria bacterium]|nr:MAG: cob(I)yrinic acid a,c-diamide adenosyltransferase [Alphaproteobacteria bacterium]
MVKLTKIYTKTGDKGKTSLATGIRLDKCDDYFNAIGDVDELNSHIGMIFSYTDDEKIKEALCRIQNDLFDIGADLATPIDQVLEIRIKKMQHIFLDQLIDFYNEELPALNSFVMPRGSILVSQIHIARAVCRRAERSCVCLKRKHSINDDVVIYLNRLSDLMFVLSRFVTKMEEELWKPALYQ